MSGTATALVMKAVQDLAAARNGTTGLEMGTVQGTTTALEMGTAQGTAMALETGTAREMMTGLEVMTGLEMGMAQGTITALEPGTAQEMMTGLEMATPLELGTGPKLGTAQRTAVCLITATLITATVVHRVTRTRRTERGWGNRETRISRRTPAIEITPTAAIQLAISGVLTRQSAGSGLVPRGVPGRKSRYLDPFRLQAVLLTG